MDGFPIHCLTVLGGKPLHLHLGLARPHVSGVGLSELQRRACGDDELLLRAKRKHVVAQPVEFFALYAPRQNDKIIAGHIRRIRLAKGVTQMKLGDDLGVTFQQLQKYETATNRISASRLFDVATALDEPVQNFFEGARRG